MRRPRRHPEIQLRRAWEEGAPLPVMAGLSALSAAYRGVLAVRARLYWWGALRTGRLPCPVVSIGNITVGGSGKTPAVELAALTLRELGARPAVVSRGYGRQTRGVHVVADRDRVLLGPRAAGDEPLLLAERLPGIPVLVGENRYEAGRRAVEAYGANAVVLDDGFQHRTVEKDLDILVINGRSPWGNGRLFPRGALREPRTAIGRAHLVMITNPATAADIQVITDMVRRHNRHAPVVSAGHRVVEARQLFDGQRAAVPTLAGRPLLAFAGLGSPQGFADTVASTGIALKGLVEFPDHHWYAQEDLAELEERAAAVGAQGLITTEKDSVRLRSLRPPRLPLWVLPVTLVLESNQDAWMRALSSVWSAAVARG